MFIKFILNKPYKNIIRGELKMRFLVQRVKKAQVDIDGQTVGRIEKGFLVLILITHTDTKETDDYFINKLINLRVFEDENGKMNLGLKEKIALKEVLKQIKGTDIEKLLKKYHVIKDDDI